MRSNSCRLLRLFTPRFGPDPRHTAPHFPKGDLSFLDAVPAIGAKFDAPSALGPSGGPTGATGDYGRTLYLSFSQQRLHALTDASPCGRAPCRPALHTGARPHFPEACACSHDRDGRCRHAPGSPRRSATGWSSAARGCPFGASPSLSRTASASRRTSSHRTDPDDPLARARSNTMVQERRDRLCAQSYDAWPRCPAMCEPTAAGAVPSGTRHRCPPGI